MKTINHHIHFNSLGAFAANADRRNHKLGWAGGSVRKGSKFHGTNTLKDAVKLAYTGWTAGANKLQELSADDIDLDGYELQRDTVRDYDVAGHYPDVAAFCAGEPECMIVEDTPSETMQPVIKLVISGAVSGSVSTDSIEKQGAAVLSVVRALQTRGFSVDLTWAIANYEADFRMATTVKICDASEPLDTESLAFALVHPSMLRRLAFAAWELDENCKPIGESFGHPEHDITSLPEYADAITLAFTNNPPSMDQLTEQYLTTVQNAMKQ